MFCNQCGRQIPDGSRFCNYCGANLTAVQATPVQSDPYFDIRHGVLVKYTGRDKNVVVPAGVVEIEENAFIGYDMESITFPEGCLKIRINTFVQRINFPSRIETFSLDCGTNYTMDAIVIPEGCVWATISCFVKTIKFPSTIEHFILANSHKGLYSNGWILSGKERLPSDRKSANEIYFAPGTKIIKGSVGGFPNLHIPSSITEIDETLSTKVRHCVGNDYEYYYYSFYGDHLICGSLNDYAPEVRKAIRQYKGLCTNCGGEFLNRIILGKHCRSCGKPKEYYSEWRKNTFGEITDKKK